MNPKTVLLAALSLMLSTAYGAQRPASEPKQLVAIGSNFYVDIATVKQSSPTSSDFVAQVYEKDATSTQTITSFKGIFSCLSRIHSEPDPADTPMNRFYRLHPGDAESDVAKKACAAAHIDNPDIKFAHAAEAGIEEAKETLKTSRWKLVAGFPSLSVPTDEGNKVVIFVDKDSISGVTGNFAVYPMDKLKAEMRADPHGYLLEAKSFMNPAFPTAPDARPILIYGVATQAAQHIEPSARYTATYDCDRQWVRVEAGGQVDSGPLQLSGADPRNIAIAARYFCPNYSVQGVTFYKFDKK